MTTTLLDLSTWMISLIGVSILIQLNRPQSWIVLPQKLLSSGFCHFLGIFGLVTGILSIVDGIWVTGILGLTGGCLLLLMWFWTIRAPTEFSDGLISNDMRSPNLKRKLGFCLPRLPKPLIVNSVVIGSGGMGQVDLDVDIWRPNENVEPSRIGLIYVDIGGWEMRAPDIAVRETFRFLTGLGHTLVRFRPRVWWQASPGDMVSDVFQAILWTRKHAESLGIDPSKIVLLGQSAGAHLSLLAAYTARESTFFPSDQVFEDHTVAGVIAIYPPVDIHKTFEHWGNWNHAGLVFGHTDEVQKRLSPINYLGNHCPPTLVLHGDHDSVVPVETSVDLVMRLQAHQVPAGYVRFPYAEHIYDMAAPSVNPATRVGLYYMERFLASICSTS